MCVFKSNIKVAVYLSGTGCPLPTLIHEIHRFSVISLLSAPYLSSQLLLDVSLDCCPPSHYKCAVWTPVCISMCAWLAFLSGVTEVGFPLHTEELKYIMEMSSEKVPSCQPWEWVSAPLHLACSGSSTFARVWCKTKEFTQHARLCCWDGFSHHSWSSAFHVSTSHLFPSLVHFCNVFPTDLSRKSLGCYSLRVYVGCLTIYQALSVHVISQNLVLSCFLWEEIPTSPQAACQPEAESGRPPDC